MVTNSHMQEFVRHLSVTQGRRQEGLTIQSRSKPLRQVRKVNFEASNDLVTSRSSRGACHKCPRSTSNLSVQDLICCVSVLREDSCQVLPQPGCHLVGRRLIEQTQPPRGCIHLEVAFCQACGALHARILCGEQRCFYRCRELSRWLDLVEHTPHQWVIAVITNLRS